VWQRSSAPPAAPSPIEEKQKTIPRNESGKIRIYRSWHSYLPDCCFQVLLQCSINITIRFIGICVNMYLRSVRRSNQGL